MDIPRAPDGNITTSAEFCQRHI